MNNDVILHVPNTFRGKINGSHIRWKDHISDTWQIEHKNIMYDITVYDVQPNEVVTFKHKEKFVTITFASMQNKLKEQSDKGYCNAGKLFYLINDNGVLGNTGHNTWVQFKYQIGDTVSYKNELFSVIESFTKSTKWVHTGKYYKLHCHRCGGDVTMSEESLNNQVRCQCCLNRVVIRGVNDIATTHPWAIKYFKNQEDVYRYHSNTWYKTDFVCPNCNRVFHNKRISQFFDNTYLINCSCGLGYKSYPERFIYNMFLQLRVDIYPQLSKADFDWCKDWKYDFYHKITNTIIEVNGIQHYETNIGCVNNWSQRDEKLNDIQKRNNAIANGITHYIELDCRKSNKDWMQSAILNSELPKIFLFSSNDIDWDKCDFDSRSNIEQSVCEAYESNVDITRKNLSDMFGVKQDTVTMYLKRGTNCGVCNYDPKSLREVINEHKTSAIHLVTKEGTVKMIATSKDYICNHKDELNIDKIQVDQIKRAESRGCELNGYTFIEVSGLDCYSQWLKFKSSLDFVFT